METSDALSIEFKTAVHLIEKRSLPLRILASWREFRIDVIFFFLKKELRDRIISFRHSRRSKQLLIPFPGLERNRYRDYYEAENSFFLSTASEFIFEYQLDFQLVHQALVELLESHFLHGIRDWIKDRLVFLRYCGQINAEKSRRDIPLVSFLEKSSRSVDYPERFRDFKLERSGRGPHVKKNENTI
jgi:hypothetical protein